MAGGHDQQTTTEKYDGTDWTNSGALGTGRRYLAGAGTQTAAVAFGGYATPSPPEGFDLTEEFYGS